MAQAGSRLNAVIGCPCHKLSSGHAAESGTQLTSAVQVRKFTQLLPFRSFAFPVSLINMYLEKSMLLLKLLFSKSSCLNRSGHTQHQALLKSIFQHLINQSINETQQKPFLLRSSLCLKQREIGSGTGAILKMWNCPSCLHPGSRCQRMLPPRLVSYFEKAALQLHIWPYVQILDTENSPNRCQGHVTLEREKKPILFKDPVPVRTSNITSTLARYR